MLISNDIAQAAALLHQDELVGLPTETVYGLAGNALSEKAVQRIFNVKQRPTYNPLILHVGRMEDLHQWVTDIPAEAQALMQAFWPGPLTLLLPAAPAVPSLVRAGLPRVAVRMPQHPLALALLQALPFPLVAPSANPFTTISPTAAHHVAHYFEGQIPMVLDGGPCQQGLESTIVGFEADGPKVYRLGSLSLERLQQVVPHCSLLSSSQKQVVAPGMLKKHYAPRIPSVLVQDVPAAMQAFGHQRLGVLSFQHRYEHPSLVACEILSPQGHADEAAQHLYAAMHRLDASEAQLLLLETAPAVGLGFSINDRLQRAAQTTFP